MRHRERRKEQCRRQLRLLSLMVEGACASVRSLRRREANGRLETVAAFLAAPQMAHAATVEILRPFRDEDLFAALAALDYGSRAGEIGRPGAKLHDFLLQEDYRTPVSPRIV